MSFVCKITITLWTFLLPYQSPAWNTAVQMFNMTTMSRVVSRKVVCQVSEFIRVMINTATNRVAITVRDPISLTLRRNLCPKRTFRMTNTAFGMFDEIAETIMV